MNQQDIRAATGPATVKTEGPSYVAPEVAAKIAAAPKPRDEAEALGNQLANGLADRLALKGWRLDHVTLAADAITVIALADEGGVTRRYEVTFRRDAGDVGKAILAWLQSLEYLRKGRR